MKDITYRSTRSEGTSLSFSQSVIQGLADDGGLLVPNQWPEFDFNDGTWKNLSYHALCFKVLAPFMPEIPAAELKAAIESAYDDKFRASAVAPLVKVGDHFILELFHGRTLAFKDMALSLLPHFMGLAQKNSLDPREIVILTATSGDTGKAALESFSDVKGTQIIVFYPTDGVSDIQKRQMATQVGDNVHVFGIEGNFDDAQTAVKSIFSDKALRMKMAESGQVFSSANSMNIGRLLPQVAYYVSAYFQLVQSGEIQMGELIHVAVPTGNFGNILAAYYAKKMGLPIDRLICASNANRVLTDFFHTGTYDSERPFTVTSSPSMDILISSNLERLLFEIVGQDTERLNELMDSLRQTGRYTLKPSEKELLKDFYAGSCSETETSALIQRVYKEWQYVLDPHTAVACSVYGDFMAETNDKRKTVIVATASPFKFSQSVLEALTDSAKPFDQTETERLQSLSHLMCQPLPEPLEEVLKSEIRHRQICGKDAIESAVRKALGLQ